MLNVMAVAASFALVSYDENLVKEALKKQFRSKPKVVEMNIAAVAAAYEYMNQKFSGSFAYKLEPVKNSEVRLFVRGNSTVAIAKELAGCRLQTYYPITPASDESEFLEAHAEIPLDGPAAHENPQVAEVAALKNKGSIAVVQTEDEIAAITMAIGGGLAGVRSSTSTSGPGFSLMAEGLGFAGMNEVPVVLTLYSRGGPSTGLPTRHEQGDLRFALHAGHGEFPRLVLASGDLEESFYDTVRAFNYSERYQTPVIHMVDKALANSDATMPKFDVTRVKIERGLLVRGPVTDAVNGEIQAVPAHSQRNLASSPARHERGRLLAHGRRARRVGTHQRRPDQPRHDDGEEDGQARPRRQGDTPRGEGQLLRSRGRRHHSRELGLDEGRDPRRDGLAQGGRDNGQLPPD